MDIKDKIIDVFENRIMQLITITNITKLPQWDDVDVLGAECLLKEYRRITSQSSGLAKLVKNQQDMPPEFNQAVDKMLDDEIANR